jgi:4-hydroxy-tetrahydrodipicolinate synthase
MFEGAYTATVTPFNRDGSVDYGKLRALVEMQIEAGMDGIVPVGTTGESPTLDYDEHIKVVQVSVESARRRIKVIAGTGANSTAEALHLTTQAKEVGADGTLQVTPYYNKPNQEGLYRHFSAVADLGLPVVLYNVPGRSCREIEVSTIARLSRHPKVVAVKEAGGNVDRVSQILRACAITVLSGDDPLTLPMMSVGGTGVISVASNLVPRAVADMVHAAQAGRWNEARALHAKYNRLFNEIFIDTNPIPIKAAMAMAGLIEETYRLPLCETSAANKQKLADCLREIGVI